MKSQTLASVAITILVFTIVYSLIPPKTIDYTEIEHGITIQSPDPNIGTPFTATLYLRNNQSKTVHIAPFNYSFTGYPGGEIVLIIIGTEYQYQVLKMRPNETIILQQKTFTPKKTGLFIIEALGIEISVMIERSDYLNLLEFQEIDEQDQLDVTLLYVSFNEISRMEHNVSLFKEFPRPVSRFTASFSVKITDIESGDSKSGSLDLFNRINVFTVTNQIGDYRSVRFNGRNELCVRVQSIGSSDYYDLEVRENHNFTTNPVKGDFRYNVNQTYYYLLEREPTTASLSVYMDHEYNELAERLDLDLNFDGGYPYVMFPQSNGYSTGNYTVSGVIGELMFNDNDIAHTTAGVEWVPSTGGHGGMWVPSSVRFNDDEFCINEFVEITSVDGYEYWNISIGLIEISPEGSETEGKQIRVFSAYTNWNGVIDYWPYAGYITEDLEIYYVRLQ